MKTIDIHTVDKSQFKCFKLEDDSMYYGEIEYLDEFNNIVTEIDKSNHEQIKALRVVRHGFGVQLYGLKNDSILSRYEGHWIKDKKMGQGKAIYSDDSIYEGNFVNELYEGQGKFTWPNNDSYIGEWKNNKMEGEGEFKHNDGHILKGKFTNNYFFDKERFINPFLGIDDLEVFKNKNSEYLSKFKEEHQKFSRANIIKVSSPQELLSYVEHTIANNKTPIILRSSS